MQWLFMQHVSDIIIIIMVIFKRYFSEELIALSQKLLKKKHYSNKQNWLKQQTALGKQALYTALYTTALK